LPVVRGRGLRGMKRVRAADTEDLLNGPSNSFTNIEKIAAKEKACPVVKGTWLEGGNS